MPRRHDGAALLIKQALVRISGEGALNFEYPRLVLVTGVHAIRSACVSHLKNRVSLLLVLEAGGQLGLKRAFV